MTLKELKVLIDSTLEQDQNGKAADLKVIVRTCDPSIGPIASSEVIDARPGIDWDSSSFIITTEHRLVKERRK